ncbi:MAG: ATP-dependent DNA helicase RecG [Planctomycetes bacterium]|nr:ATP-dependent DNA helicase RecG [Planctomycetota bacterium]
MQTPNSDNPLQYVRGVGPRKAEAFASLGLHTVGQLLEYFPFRYETHLGDVEIADLQPGMNATIRGEVLHLHRSGPHMSAEISDGSGECMLRWFNQPYAGRGLRIGATVVATGKVEVFHNDLQIVQPSLRVFESDAELRAPQPGERQYGVYSGNAAIKSNTIRRVVLNLLDAPQLPVAEFLPARLLSAHRMPPREQAIRQMHAPDNDKSLESARRRLAYEEFFLLETAMAIRRRKLLSVQVGIRLHATKEIDARIRARFPFPLTAAQDKVIREIVRDVTSGRPMTRLLQGDVGSGKTVVALYACLLAVAAGRQTAIMAPTEILAAQHLANIERYLEGSRVRRTLLRGGIAAGRRTEALRQIEAGEIDLVVGTQALLEQDVSFKALALAVVDEQHKFGVMQRAGIRTKGALPHYLVMTATPIPRTLAMTVFGDLDVSIVDASPPGRGRITTRVVVGRQWATVMNYVRGRLEAGEQAYVVCPTIGEDVSPLPENAAGQRNAATRPQKAAELRSVRETYQQLVDGPWKGLPIGLLHGGLKSDEKQRAIREFAEGKLRAVVATTVVEVGVDVPNATIMVVEHAERFGLSQLHQLRGRVGRGARDSLCVLIARGSTPQLGGAPRGKAGERLAVLAETTDGFRIAEADLRQRGPGELLGTRQHGLPELRIGRLVEDFDLLEAARRDAFELVAADPALRKPEHAVLIPHLKRMFGDKLALIDAG